MTKTIIKIFAAALVAGLPMTAQAGSGETGESVQMAQVTIQIGVGKINPRLTVPGGVKINPAALRPNCPNPAIRSDHGTVAVAHVGLFRPDPGDGGGREHGRRGLGVPAWPAGGAPDRRAHDPGGQRFHAVEPGPAGDRELGSGLECLDLCRVPAELRGRGLAYDPDIYIDGNRQNDDCKRVDNRRTLDGHTINAMVRG